MEVEWDMDMQMPKRTPGGTSGYATVHNVVQGSLASGDTFRMHVCTETPCEAHWDDTKYGLVGQPLHVVLAAAPAVAGALAL